MKPNNPFEILIEDHNELKSVMSEIESHLDKDNNNLNESFQRFKDSFHLHDKTEDKIIYPALLKHSRLKKLILKGYQAHHMVEVGILELKITPYKSDNWGPKFLVIKDAILSHMQEEEKTVFPAALNILNKHEADEIHQEIMDARALE